MDAPIPTQRTVAVTIADENYLALAKRFFSGVHFKAGWRGDRLLLSHGIPEEKKRWFLDRGILVREAPGFDYTGSLDVVKKFPASMFVKFRLFETWVKQWDNVVYIDADVLVRGSIEPLANVRGLAAVRDACGDWKYQLWAKNGSNAALYRELGREGHAPGPSLNAGVLAFSTDIVGEDTFDRLHAMTLKYAPLFRTGDQPALNILFANRWRPLPVAYNALDYLFMEEAGVPAGMDGAVLLHLVNFKKKMEQYAGTFFAREWDENLRQADSIDPSVPRPPARIFSDAEIAAFERLHAWRYEASARELAGRYSAVRRAWHRLKVGAVNVLRSAHLRG